MAITTSNPAQAREIAYDIKVGEALERDNSSDDYEAEWTLVHIGDFTYLRGRQNGYYGEGKFSFMCGDEGNRLYAFYYADEHADDIIENGKFFYLMIDGGKTYTLPAPDPYLNRNNWVNALHVLDMDLFPKMMEAEALTYMIQDNEGDNRYRGFTITIKNNSDKKLVRDYFSKCMGR